MLFADTLIVLQYLIAYGLMLFADTLIVLQYLIAYGESLPLELAPIYRGHIVL